MKYGIGFLEGGGRWLGLGLRNPVLAPGPVGCLLLPSFLDGAHSCAPTHVCVFGLVSFGLLGVRACVFFFISTLAGDGVGVIGRVGQLFPDTLVWFAVVPCVFSSLRSVVTIVSLEPLPPPSGGHCLQ